MNKVLSRILQFGILFSLIIGVLSTWGCGNGPDSEIIEAFSPVCQGIGVSQAADYAQAGEPHSVILLRPSGKRHSWIGEMPEDWWPTSVSDVELVAIVDKKLETVIQTCEYTGGHKVKRIQYVLDVELREAKTSDVVARTRLYGDVPGNCPRTILETETTITGSLVSHDDLKQWLERYVVPTQWATRWPQYAHMNEDILDLESNSRTSVGHAKRKSSYQGLSLTYHSVTYSAPPGKVFVIVSFYIQNCGREKLEVNKADFRLIDSANSQYTPADYRPGPEEKFEEEFDFGIIRGPGRKGGELLFEVDKKATESLEFVFNFGDSWENPKLAIWQLRAQQDSDYYD